MAATVSAWSKPGAWALDAEEHEEELIQQEKIEKENGNHLFFSGNRLQKQEQQQQQQPLADFPTLSAAVTTKTKKKKAVAVPLSEFTTGKQVTHGSAAKFQPSRGLTTDELLVLPTGPRERTAEELERGPLRLGGGFRSFEGGRSSSRYSNGGEDSSSRWGSDESKRGGGGGGGFNRENNNRESGPSRADENDDWGAGKKSMGASAFERRERGGGGTGAGFFDSQSRADDSDSWVSNKNRVASSMPPRRVGGGGFENPRERRGGFEFQKETSNGGGADSDTWGKKREEGIVTERPRLSLKPKTVSPTNGEQQQHQEEPGSGTTVKSKGSNPFGEARPREEVLAEKGQDWKKMDEQLESVKIKDMGSTDPSGEASQGQDWKKIDEQLEPVKIRETRSINPFGQARPREEVLAEKGQDWKKIDEQLESAKIKEMGSTNGSSFGSKPLSNGNGRVTPPEHRMERSWRKPESVVVAPPSAEQVEENGAVHSAEQVEEDAAVEAEN